ncbi:hypothetical protein KIPB_004885, partial [Kipferlia bialata]|eukprot:g4885.t1
MAVLSLLLISVSVPVPTQLQTENEQIRRENRRLQASVLDTGERERGAATRVQQLEEELKAVSAAERQVDIWRQEAERAQATVVRERAVQEQLKADITSLRTRLAEERSAKLKETSLAEAAKRDVEGLRHTLIRSEKEGELRSGAEERVQVLEKELRALQIELEKKESGAHETLARLNTTSSQVNSALFETKDVKQKLTMVQAECEDHKSTISRQQAQYEEEKSRVARLSQTLEVTQQKLKEKKEAERAATDRIRQLELELSCLSVNTNDRDQMQMVMDSANEQSGMLARQLREAQDTVSKLRSLIVMSAGASSTGKTCLLRRYIYDIFEAGTKATIAAEFESFEMSFKNK